MSLNSSKSNPPDPKKNSRSGNPKKRKSELVIDRSEYVYQKEEKARRAEELTIAHEELAFQQTEKEKRADELVLANRELAFQNKEKEKRAAELIIANRELAFQNHEKEERAAELMLSNEPLAKTQAEEDQRSDELIVAYQELAFQNMEKEKRAAELIIANQELAFQNREKELRAAELLVANEELAYQNKEKEKRAAELIIANRELAFQNQEKEERAEELLVANKELAYQNMEKEKRAAELIIANQELAFQNREKELRAAELLVANEELTYQNEKKEKRAAELVLANEERDKMISSLVQHTKNLEQFTSIISHNLRAPVAHILGLSNVMKNNISSEDRNRTQKYLISAAEQLDEMLKDLNVILQAKGEINEYKEIVQFNTLVDTIKSSIQTSLENKNVIINTDFTEQENIFAIRSYMYSIFYNLISNSIKYQQRDLPPVITIRSEADNDVIRIFFEDNGIGIDLSKHGNQVFGLYKRFHDHTEGKGLGLFMVKTQVETLGGTIQIKSTPNSGTEFIIELPNGKQ